MSIAKAVVFDGANQRQLQSGDVLAGAEVIPAATTGTAITLGAADLAKGIYLGNPSGAATYTFDSAANIIAGLLAGIGSTGFQPGTTFRFRIINANGTNAITPAVTANTGMTINRANTVAVNTSREFLISIVNGTPVQTIAGMTTNASAVVSGFTQAQLQSLTIGMIVTNSVNGLQGTTIIGINIAAGTVTLSGNANATSSTPVSITFSPVITVDGF